MSTIKNADLILSIEKGEVIEQGTHEQLMEQKGLYYTLVLGQIDKGQKFEEKTDSDHQEESVDQQISDDVETESDVNDSEEVVDESSTTKKIKRRRLIPGFLLSLLRLNAPEWSFILIGSIASLLLGATSPVLALFLAEIYKLFIEVDLARQARLTRLYAIGIILCGFVGGVCLFVASWAFAKSGEELVMRVRRRIFATFLRQEINYFDQESNSVGALTLRLSADASALKVRLE